MNILHTHKARAPPGQLTWQGVKDQLICRIRDLNVQKSEDLKIPRYATRELAQPLFLLSRRCGKCLKVLSAPSLESTSHKYAGSLLTEHRDILFYESIDSTWYEVYRRRHQRPLEQSCVPGRAFVLTTRITLLKVRLGYSKISLPFTIIYK